MKNLYILLILFTSQSAFAYKIAVISDMNASYGSTHYATAVDKTIKHLLKLNPDLVISTGDMVAGQKSGLNYLKMWQSFHKTVTKPLINANIPFVVTPGNHDGSLAYAFREERQIYRKQWNIYKPTVNFVSSIHYPDFYAFKDHNILFISLDATLVGKLSSKQMSWLKESLKKSKNYKHTFVFGHLPILETVKKKAQETLQAKELLKLFKKSNVTAYLSGHHHAYYPGYFNDIHHVSQGCLGSGNRRLIGSDKRAVKSFTLIEVSNSIDVQAFDVHDNFKMIDKKTLPESISTSEGKLIRDDLI